MQTSDQSRHNRSGKIKYAIVGWLAGLPTIVVIILLFTKGCDF